MKNYIFLLHLFITNIFLKKYKRKLVIKSEKERLFGKKFKIYNPNNI